MEILAINPGSWRWEGGGRGVENDARGSEQSHEYDVIRRRSVTSVDPGV